MNLNYFSLKLKLHYIRLQKRRKIKFLQKALERGDLDRVIDHVYRDVPRSQRPYALYRESIRELILSLKEEIGEVQAATEEVRERRSP